jgi:hypothetical protein
MQINVWAVIALTPHIVSHISENLYAPIIVGINLSGGLLDLLGLHRANTLADFYKK